jgi:anti-sigma regulatory factor (Ser/Thr protein kinase)
MAHISEDITMQMLQPGPASFTSDTILARGSAPASEARAVGSAEHNRQRLFDCLMRTESHFLLDNDPSLVPPLLGILRENLQRMNLCDEIGLIRVTVALSEALTSAIVHGNLEIDPQLRDTDERAYQRLVEERRRQKPFRDRRVHVIAKELLHEAHYVVRHEGPGFDLVNLPGADDPGALEKVSARGLVLIGTFMDEVSHNEAGKQVTMLKRIDR